MSVYETLLDTVRQHGAFHPLTANEATEEYLKRLAKAVSGVTKRLFDDMSDDAQLWFDNAATAMSEQMPVPLPEGFVRDNVKPMDRIDPNRGAISKAIDDAVQHEVIEAKEPASPPRRPRPTGTAIPPRPHMVPPPPRPPVPPPAYGDEPLTITIQRLVIADQDMSVHNLIKRLQEQNIKASNDTVRTTRSRTLSIIRMLREAGWQAPM